MFNYYTFEGPIISLDDNSGILTLAGLSVKDKIRYTFLINREMEGTRTGDDGSTYTYDNDRLRIYFYTHLVNGSRIHTLNQFDSQRKESFVTYNRGFESDRRFDLLSGSEKHYVNIWGVSISDWPDGSTLHGLECVYDNIGGRSVISSKLSLVSISDIYSHPAGDETTPYNGVDLLQQYFRC